MCRVKFYGIQYHDIDGCSTLLYYWTLEMNINDKYTLGLGLLVGATFIPDSTKGSSNVITTVMSQSVQGDNSFGVPIVYPFGFISLPPDNTYGITINVTGLTTNPICLGTVPSSVNLYSMSGIVKGEGATYSLNYSIQAKLSGLIAKLNNSAGTNTATMLYGENIIKVIIDIITQMETFYSTQLSSIISQLNSHTHSVPNISGGNDTATSTSMASSGTNISTPEIGNNLPQDLVDIQAGKAYVNDTGEPM